MRIPSTSTQFAAENPADILPITAEPGLFTINVDTHGSHERGEEGSSTEKWGGSVSQQDESLSPLDEEKGLYVGGETGKMNTDKESGGVPNAIILEERREKTKKEIEEEGYLTGVSCTKSYINSHPSSHKIPALSLNPNDEHGYFYRPSFPFSNRRIRPFLSVIY